MLPALMLPEPEPTPFVNAGGRGAEFGAGGVGGGAGAGRVLGAAVSLGICWYQCSLLQHVLNL